MPRLGVRASVNHPRERKGVTLEQSAGGRQSVQWQLRAQRTGSEQVRDRPVANPTAVEGTAAETETP